MRSVGLDVGSRTIGVAVSDERGIVACGLDTIKRRQLKEDLARLKEFLNSVSASQLVVGLPKNLKGEIGPQAKMVLEFVEVMKKEMSVPVILWDERLSTQAAERVLLEADLSRKKRKKVKDKLAATIILQNYLDSQQLLKAEKKSGN